MAHAVEQMMFVGATPWHGLGNQLDEAPTISEAITAAGLDWEVGLKDLFTGEGTPVPARATYRKTDNSILGVVGPRYTPLQNSDAFDWFQPFLDANECQLHTAGSLHSGQKVWVLAQLNRDNSEIVKGDEVSKFILLSNSHDGTTAIRVGYTPIRVVCANTMAMAHSKGSGSQLIGFDTLAQAKRIWSKYEILWTILMSSLRLLRNSFDSSLARILIRAIFVGMLK
jgi:phage/plasmid-like protein (TIGR03299 family)